MVNLIITQTLTGGGLYDELPNIPQKCVGISMQARTADVDFRYRFRGQTAYWTVKSGAVRSLIGLFQPGDIQLNGDAGTIVEIEFIPDGISA